MVEGCDGRRDVMMDGRITIPGHAILMVMDEGSWTKRSLCEKT